jgi:signal transduction histidine kinase
MPSFLGHSEHKLIEALVEGYIRTSDDRKNWVEKFKSSNSILKNSLRYLPELGQELLSQELNQSTDLDLIYRLEDLFKTILLYSLGSQQDLQPVVIDQVHALEAIEDSVIQPQTALLIRLTLDHSYQILHQKPRLDRLTQKLLKSPTVPKVQKLELSYNLVHQRAVTSTQSYRLYAYLLFLMLSGWLALFVIRQLNDNNQVLCREIQERQETERALQRSEASLQVQNQKMERTLKRLKNAQAQLVQSEKMSSLGQMMAGIAHEINNPVSFIHGNLKPLQGYADDLLHLLQLYQTYHEKPSPALNLLIGQAIEETELNFIRKDLPQLLSSIRIGTERIREIILSLRNFSRLDEAEFKQVNLQEGIDNTLLLLTHRLNADPGTTGIEVVKEYMDVPLVTCYPGQLNQVF